MESDDRGELKPTMMRALPGGKMDDSTYAAIEDALDRIEAPMVGSGRFLTLAERIQALTPDLASLREERDRLQREIADLRGMVARPDGAA